MVTSVKWTPAGRAACSRERLWAERVIMRRKFLFVIVALIVLIIGYLGYDYYLWSKYLEPDPSVSLYGWTDAEGVRHFTNRPPPQGARDIQVTEGFKHRGLPLVLKAEERIVRIFRKDSAKAKKKAAPKK
jgi:hypothetical protein